MRSVDTNLEDEVFNCLPRGRKERRKPKPTWEGWVVASMGNRDMKGE